MDNTHIIIITLSTVIVGLLIYKYVEDNNPKAIHVDKQVEKYSFSDIANTYKHSISGLFDRIITEGLIANDIHGGVTGMSGNSLQFADSARMKNRGGIFNNIRDSSGHVLDVGQNVYVEGDDYRNIEGYIMMDHAKNSEPRYEELKGWY